MGVGLRVRCGGAHCCSARAMVQGGGALVVVGEGVAVGPLGGQGAVEPLDLPFCQGSGGG